jgi:hypothetical protein
MTAIGLTVGERLTHCPRPTRGGIAQGLDTVEQLQLQYSASMPLGGRRACRLPLVVIAKLHSGRQALVSSDALLLGELPPLPFCVELIEALAQAGT